MYICLPMLYCYTFLPLLIIGYAINRTSPKGNLTLFLSPPVKSKQVGDWGTWYLVDRSQRMSVRLFVQTSRASAWMHGQALRGCYLELILLACFLLTSYRGLNIYKASQFVVARNYPWHIKWYNQLFFSFFSSYGTYSGWPHLGCHKTIPRRPIFQ